MKAIYTILLLIISNVLMIFAWYGHLRLSERSTWFATLPLFGVIIFSWIVAFFEYIFMIPANRIGFVENGGPFTMLQLKIMQEVITLVVFVVMSQLWLGGGHIAWNHYAAGALLVGAVWLAFV